MNAAIFLYVGPYLMCLMPGFLYFSPVHLCTLQIMQTQGLFCLAFSKSSVRETHTCLLSEDDCTLYQRQDPRNRQKIQIRRRWSEVVFGVSAREVLEHTSANRCLVDSRWCSSITGAKFCRGGFSGPLPFLSSHQM